MRYLIFRGSLCLLLLSGCGLILDGGPARQDERFDSGAPVDGSIRDAAGRDGALGLDAASSDGGLDAGSTLDAGFDGGAGDSGTRTDAAMTLDAGMDATVCGPEETVCNGTCVSLRRSDVHCGVCNNPCGSEQFCQQGACVEGWVDVAAGARHTCGVTHGGRVFCWGVGQNQTGVANGTPTAPTQIVDSSGNGIDVAVSAGAGGPFQDQLAVGDRYSCVLDPQRLERVMCWGSLVTGTGSRFAASVDNTEGFDRIAGGNTFACAINDSVPTRLSCWGSNEHFQLGQFDRAFESDEPVQVAGRGDFRAVALGDAHGCFEEGGSVQCWGQGTQGQFGVPSLVDSANPVVSVPQGLGPMSGGFQHQCGINTAGEVLCWGGVGSVNPNNGADLTSGLYGRPQGSPVFTPVEVPLAATGYEIAVGDFHGCAASAIVSGDDRSLECWGFVPLESGAVNPPEAVAVGDAVLQAHIDENEVMDLEAGTKHTCAIFNDNRLYCWGENTDRQLGCENTSPGDLPVCEVPIPTAGPVPPGS